MFFAAIENVALTLLGDTILIVGRNVPPAIIHARVDARLVVFEADGFQNQRPIALRFVVGRETEPESHGFGVVNWNTKTNSVIRNPSFARRGVTRMRRKDPM